MLGFGLKGFGQNITLCTPQTSESGFFINKCVTLPPLPSYASGGSSNSVETGQTFQYTIWFTLPTGATDVAITDEIPSDLTILNTIPGLPDVTISANIITYSVPAGTASNISHSLTINVKFPAKK